MVAEYGAGFPARRVTEHRDVGPLVEIVLEHAAEDHGLVDRPGLDAPRICETPSTYAVRSRLVRHGPDSAGHAPTSERPSLRRTGSVRSTSSIRTAVSSPSKVITTTQKPLVRSSCRG